MKRLVLAAVLALSTTAFAAPKATQTEGVTDGAHNVALTLGATKGGFTIGAEYEYMVQNEYGIGGVIKNYSKHTGNLNTDPNLTPGVFIVGAQASAHFVRTSWGDLALTPGFDIINISRITNSNNSITAGPSLAISATRQIYKGLAVGFEWVQYYSWFDVNFNGLVQQDISAKLRYTF